MTERPILLSGAMVRAILDGRKTQVRRLVAWPDWAHPDEIAAMLCRDPHCLEHDPGHPKRRLRCPYGRRGDRLWVRERWSPAVSSPAATPASIGSLAIARADEVAAYYEADGSMLPPQSRWHPAIHMPRHLSRILLEVEGVRVERLQDISVRDALAEGLEPAGDDKAVNDWFRPHGWARDAADNARLVFADLWDSVHSRRGQGWKQNPWVWAVDFRRIVPD